MDTISDLRSPIAEGRAKAPAEPNGGADLPVRLGNDRTVVVLMSVAAERRRQETLCAAGKFPFNGATPGVPLERKLPILVEEVGEVAKELNEGPPDLTLALIFDRPAAVAHLRRLRCELVQVAAVAAAICESIDALLEGRAKAPAEPPATPVPEPAPYAGGVL